MNYITKLVTVSVLSMILLIIPVLASEPPLYPMILCGDILVNDENAPVGTTIEVYDGTTCIGTVTITNEGEYGLDSLTTRLAVNELSTGTTDVKIYIKTPSMSSPVEANEKLDFWDNSDVARLDLSADVTGSSSGQRSSSSSSSSGLISTGENNDVEAMPGGNGLDPGLNKLEAQPFQDTTSSSGSDDPSNVNSKSPIIIALLIGIIALIAIFYGRSKNMF